jgi:CheY-like chemotaxis protein
MRYPRFSKEAVSMEKLSVLIVDDDASIQNVLREALADGGFASEVKTCPAELSSGSLPEAPISPSSCRRSYMLKRSLSRATACSSFL